MKKPIPLLHDDTIDRRVGKEFLEERGWWGIEYGGTYDLDLMVPEFSRGCDVEMNWYNHSTQFQNEGCFRVPYRKQKYWMNDGPWGSWKVDYLQFSENDTKELLWYPYKVIEGFRNNLVVWKGLMDKGYTKNQATFIRIPFVEGKKFITHWKQINGVWTQQTW
jgi:hypothetical protein